MKSIQQTGIIFAGNFVFKVSFVGVAPKAAERNQGRLQTFNAAGFKIIKKKFPRFFAESGDGTAACDFIVFPGRMMTELPRGKIIVFSGECIECSRMFQAGKKVFPDQGITAAGNYAPSFFCGAAFNCFADGTAVAAAFKLRRKNGLIVNFKIIGCRQFFKGGYFKLLEEPVARTAENSNFKETGAVSELRCPAAVG